MLPVNEIALGLTDYLPELGALAPQAHDYRHYNLDPYSPGFVRAVREMIDKATRIHFNLTGMLYISHPDGVLLGPPELNTPGGTNWELRTIWDDDVLCRKTVFYREWKSISHDQVAQLP